MSAADDSLTGNPTVDRLNLLRALERVGAFNMLVESIKRALT